MKIKLTKNIEKEVSIGGICKELFTSWQRYYKFIFVVFFAGVIAYLGYVWYEAFYGNPWSPQDKEDYMTINSERINFDKERYNQALDFIEKRKNKFNSSAEEVKDIFY